MLKITGLLNKPASSRNKSRRSAFNKNDNSKPAFKRNNSNTEVNRFGINRNSVEHTKKSGELS